MLNQIDQDDGIQLRNKSSGFLKRLNITSEPRPKSLITYEVNEPVSPNTTNKTTPPVLARVRSINSNETQNGNLGNQRASLAPVEELVICGICLEKFTNPKMLRCQHVFCLNCLESEFQEKNIIKCINCSTEITEIKNLDDLKNLPTNLYIDSLLNFLKGANNVNSMPNQVEVDVHCVKCQTACEDNYQKCRHCKQVFCEICWNDHLTEISNQISNLDKQLDSALKKIDHKMNEAKDRIDLLKDHIKSHAHDQIKLIQEQERKLKENADKILKTELSLSDPIIKRINQLKLSILNEKNSNDKISSFMVFHKHASEIFKEIGTLNEQKIILNKENFSIEILTSNNDERILNDQIYEKTNKKDEKKGIVKNELIKITTTTSVDTIKDYYMNKNFKLNFYWCKNLRPGGIGVAPWIDSIIGQKLLYITGSDNRVIYAIQMTNGKIAQKLEHEKLIFPNSLCFSKNRREIFITDKWNHCIFVFSDSGEFLRILSSKGDMEGFLRSPEGISMSDDDLVVVCDTGNDRIQFLDPDTGAMIQQIGDIKGKQMNNKKSIHTDFKAPTGVAFYKENLIVLDSGNRRVKIFDKNGLKLKEFGVHGDLPGQFKYPEAIAVDENGFICVGDGGSSRVQIFQPSGQLLTAFGSRGNVKGKFSWISGVAITQDLKIIVSDSKNYSVQIFG